LDWPLSAWKRLRDFQALGEGEHGQPGPPGRVPEGEAAVGGGNEVVECLVFFGLFVDLFLDLFLDLLFNLVFGVIFKLFPVARAKE
jgi:hypothetical protein